MSDPVTTAAPHPEADSIKKSLEYQILAKSCAVTVQGKRIEVDKWGLKKSIVLGSKVMRMAVNIQDILAATGGDAPTTDTCAQLLGVFAEDIFGILAQSISVGPSQPFQNVTQVEEWLDTLTVEDVFNLSYMVYHMNLEGEKLGKLSEGLGAVARKVTSLSMSSPKS